MMTKTTAPVPASKATNTDTNTDANADTTPSLGTDKETGLLLGTGGGDTGY